MPANQDDRIDASVSIMRGFASVVGSLYGIPRDFRATPGMTILMVASIVLSLGIIALLAL